MPRLPNVTAQDLETAEAEAFACSQMAYDFAKRIEQGYCQEIAEPLKLATSFMAASRAFADLASCMLTKSALAEQERRIEADLKQRIAANQ